MGCSNPTCQYETPANIPTYELVIKALEIHVRSAHSEVSNRAQSGVKTEKIKRPTINANMSESDWTFFTHKWDRYSRQSNVSGQQLLDELWACLDPDLERLAFQDGLQASTAEDLLSKIKTLAVTAIHPSLHVVALHQLKQNEQESTKAFSARVRGVAANCNLEKKCSETNCPKVVSFLEETCYHVVMTGLLDENLKEKVLTQAMLGVVKDLASLVDYATAEEASRQKSPLKELAAITRKASSEKQQQKLCHYCGQNSHGAFNKLRTKYCTAYGKKCTKCSRLNHFASVCRSAKSAAITVEESSESIEEEPTVNAFLASILPKMQLTSVESARKAVNALKASTNAAVTTLPVPHHVFCKLTKKWKRTPPKPSPTLQVSVTVDKPAYAELGLLPPELIKKQGAGHARARIGTADTGAQITVINESEITALGVKKHSLFPLAMSINTVTRNSIDLIGGIFLKFSAYNQLSGTVTSTRQLCYVSRTVQGIYFSEEACRALQCIPDEFPAVGINAGVTPQVNACQNTGVRVQNDDNCNCPRRQLPPVQPPVLPCEPIVENLPILKSYILERYASSAFNCCEQQALPLMDSAPPLRLFVDEQATPVAALTPSKVPLHWAKDVKAGLDRDVQLGVIEQVPVNDPVKWCSRMVVTPKTDGTPRRVIDFSPINKHAPRQLHHTRSPYNIATSVPANTVKTVLDNWNGYHSVSIHPDDRSLTTFITPYGR